MRFYDINNNTIMVDNYDINNIKLDNYRLNYSMVLQDTWLFEGSFYDNISYGNKNVTLEQVKKACKDALIDDFIEKLPNGYDTIINDNAINISIGQRQQVVIARALLSESKILILDEATSNVDTLTEVKIQKAMTKLMHNKTCFIIAHRLSTIKNADKILVMKDGEIIESGKHKELLEKNGYYKEIYMSQFEIV
jgi:ATP-binding cassette subfamily B protein